MAGVHNLRVNGNHVDFVVDPDSLDQAMIALTSVGVTSLTSRPPTLEELFLRHYGDESAPVHADQGVTS
jgi:hypothetical protein